MSNAEGAAIPSGAPLILQLGSTGVTLSASLDRLGAALRYWGAPGRCEFASLLIFEELVTNVLRHGVRGDLPLRLVATVSPRSDGVHISIEDDGVPFDPVSAQPDSRRDPFVPGGRGLNLVRAMASSLSYERRAGINHVEAVVASA